MRSFPALIVLLAALYSAVPYSATAFAQSAPMEETLGSTQPLAEPPPPPSVDEYKNIPPGMLMTAEDNAPPADEVATTPSDDDVMTMDDMVVAYNKGEYDRVVKHIIPVANGSYPQAEELLGIMYLKGQGVTQDPEQAIGWLTKAAEAGRPLAQHYLATMTFAGNGIQADSVKALMWLYISIVHYPDGPDKDRARQDRDNLAAQLSRRDRERAYEMAHDWLGKRDEAALLGPQP